MSSSEIRATLVLDASQFNSTMSQVKSGIQGMTSSGSKSLAGLGASISTFGKGLQSAGMQATIAGAAIQQIFKPIAGILTESMKASIDYESAFAGVRKTVDATEPEFDALSSAIRNMSKEMPESAENIAKVMEIAGQLGIRGVDDLINFTKTAVMMGDTTNLSAESASTQMARFLNITGSGTETVDNLGACIVDLGNNTATTEAEIMSMGLRIAAAGRQVGLTDSEILGFSASLSSLGIRAEMGGSAFSKLMVNMEVACQNGGESLDNFASVAGMSADEFKTAFEQDAAGAIISFLGGLNDIEANGGSVIKTLDDMGIGEVRLRDTILRAAAGVKDMNGNLELADKAYESNTALVDEAGKRYETTASKIEMFKNRIHDVGISVGDAMKPAFDKLLEIGNKVIDWVETLDPKFLGIIGTIGAVGVAVGGALMFFGLLATAIGGVVSVIGGVIGALAAIAAPIGIAVGAVALLGGAFTYCWNEVDGFKESVSNSFQTIANVISEVSSTIWGYLQEVWGAISPWLIPMLQDMAATIGNIFDTIMVVISTVVDAVWSKIQAVWGAIQPYAVTIFGGIAEFLGGIWEVISGIINGACDFIKAVIEGDWDAAKEAILNAGQKMWDGVVQCWDAIKGTVTDVCKMVYDTIKDKWDSMLNAIKDKLSSMKTEAEQKWNDIKTAVSNKCSDIKTDLEQKWNDMKTAVSQKCSDIKTDAVEKWNNIKSDVGSAMTDLKSDISSKWSDIKSNISSTASDILSAIKQPFVDGWNAIKSIPGDIMNAFSSIKISIPTPRLPQINVGSKEVFGISIPTFSVSWNAKGAFFDKASIVGMGEAGKEAILPLENKRYMKPYATAVASLMNDMNSSSGETVYNNIEVKQMVVREEADIKRVAEELQRLQDRENRRRRGRDD